MGKKWTVSEEKRRFVCPTCGRKFISQYHLNQHLKIESLKREDKGVIKKITETVKTEGGVEMEEKDIQKLVNDAIAGVKNNITSLSKKVEETSSSVSKVVSSLPEIVAKTIQKIEEEKRKREEEQKKQIEWERKMRDLEEVLKHKDDIISFCKTNPKLCKIEVDKLLPKEKEHLPHKTVAETLACPECGPALLRGISKNIVENEEFAKKFISSLKETKADNRLRELIEIGQKVQKGGEGGGETGKPNDTETKKEGSASKEETRSTGLF